MDFAWSTGSNIGIAVPFVHFFDGSGHQLKSKKWKNLPLTICGQWSMINMSFSTGNRQCHLTAPYFADLHRIRMYISRGANRESVLSCSASHCAEKTWINSQIDRRQYNLFDYVGAPGCWAHCYHDGFRSRSDAWSSDYLSNPGKKSRIDKRRLFRPLVPEHFVRYCLHPLKQSLCLIEQKNPEALVNRWYLDIRTSIGEAMADGMWKGAKISENLRRKIRIRFQEFSGAMAKAVLDNLKKDVPKNHFTIGIIDDVTKTSLDSMNIQQRTCRL